ncbi:hypothetical protein [Streptomyces sp. WAC 04229]|uniref:hypothetical protein n=1 Tax=Streptomyces sp. WAC 04229 TaxID=2203206 RepID=UPI000F73966D|nr:hypothetical protein [Streptomyces sp. WAC 04229]
MPQSYGIKNKDENKNTNKTMNKSHDIFELSEKEPFVYDRIILYVSIVITPVMALFRRLFRRIEAARTPVAVWDDPTLRAQASEGRPARRSLRTPRTMRTSEPKRA